MYICCKVDIYGYVYCGMQLVLIDCLKEWTADSKKELKAPDLQTK